MVETNLYPFLASLIAVAFLFSSVGHGGASGYLAAMALFGVSTTLMRPAALIMNIIVSAISFYHFYKEGYFRWKLFILLAGASIPAAYLGACISLPEDIYRKTLGAFLIFPFLKLSFPDQIITERIKSFSRVIALFSGASIGLISGMIGIGGGIILSPLLLYLKWSDIKETAAISACFILVNSISGILAISGSIYFDNMVFYWILAVSIGALAGSFLGSKKFNNNLLKQILAGVILIAVIKLLIT